METNPRPARLRRRGRPTAGPARTTGSGRRSGARRVVATGGLAVAAVLAAATPAAALPYDGTDPSATGCAASAITVASAPVIEPIGGIQVGTVELRWSTTCQTNWARVTRTDGLTSYPMATAVHRGATGDSVGEYLSGYSSIYSNQLYGQGYLVCADARIGRPGGVSAANVSTACA